VDLKTRLWRNFNMTMVELAMNLFLERMVAEEA